MPDLEASIWQEYGDDGVLVYGLYQGESAAQLQDFVEQTGVTFPIVRDVESTLGQFAYPDGVGYPYPRDVVVGKDLTVRLIRNSFNAGEMRALVEGLLAE